MGLLLASMSYQIKHLIFFLNSYLIKIIFPPSQLLAIDSCYNCLLFLALNNLLFSQLLQLHHLARWVTIETHDFF